MMYACDNCEWTGQKRELQPIKRYWERVDEDSGHEPDGECPKCGCLAYARPDDGDDGEFGARVDFEFDKTR
jgi:hypothetical protein